MRRQINKNSFFIFVFFEGKLNRTLKWNHIIYPKSNFLFCLPKSRIANNLVFEPSTLKVVYNKNEHPAEIDIAEDDEE